MLPATIFFLAWYSRLHPARRLRGGLHGRVGLRGPDRRLRARADAVRDGLRARARCTCARPTATYDPLAQRVDAPATTAARPDGAPTSRFDRREADAGATRWRDDRRSPPSTSRRSSIFAIVLAITLGITYWASKRADERRSLLRRRPRDHRRPERPRDLGRLPVAPRRSSASPGLIFLYGFDGFLYSVGFLVAFLTVMFLLAERMRNAGKYTIADVLAFRLRERPARVAAAIGHAGRRRLLPDRADGRRGRADPGARRHRLHPRGAPHRHLHALLRGLRRHARHDLGADHQGRAADDRHRS